MALILLHILAGTIGLASGAIALCARKGAPLHRMAGMSFVYSMLIMSAVGAGLASMTHRGLGGELLAPQRLSVVAGVLTFYLVATSLLTVRRRAPGPNWIDLLAMLLALTVGVASVTFAIEALNRPTEALNGESAAPGFVFGAVALLAALGDMRMMRAGGIQGAHRIARHLWRMCFGLFIAAFSFFIGQAKVFPEPIRILPLLATPVLLVLVLMLYWLVRVLREPEPIA
jgi:hypothetical protein